MPSAVTVPAAHTPIGRANRPEPADVIMGAAGQFEVA
jgi:hypothetical protein